MRLSKSNTIWIAVAVPVLVSAVSFVGNRFISSSPDPSEYPDAPFERVPAGYPRIIPLESGPSPDDAAATTRYRSERRAVAKYLTEEGAIRKASAKEREAVRAAAENNYVRARELAQEVLRNDPEAVPALRVLAEVEYEGEGNLPRALRIVRKARHLVEARGRTDPADADSREWYLRCLDLEYEILFTMDRCTEVLETVRLMEQVYPELPWRKIWPLFKLNRLDEAEQTIDATEKHGGWQMSVLNCRSALAQLRGDRRLDYEAVQKMVAYRPQSPVYWSNFAEAALGEFRLEEAEKAYLRSAKEAEKNGRDYIGTSYIALAQLYLQQGRFQETVDALRHARADRAKRPAYTLQVDQTKIDCSLALVLLALGREADAERFARRACEQPDRTGHSTRSRDGDALIHGVVLWTILESQLERLRETEAAMSWSERAAAIARRQSLAMEAWSLKHRLLRLMMEEDHWKVLCPYLLSDCNIESWLLGGVVQILPASAMAEALRQARDEETHPSAIAYFDAVEAELALSRGDPGKALELARKAMARLPAEKEKLLWNRVSAIGAEAARQLGQTDECLKLANQVLGSFPQVFRLLKARIPVHIEDDGSPLAQALARRLRGCARFFDEDRGLPIAIKTRGNHLTFEMFRLGKARHFEGSVPIAGDDSAVIERAAQRFFERLMSPAIDLTQVEINSLDGSPAVLQSQGAVDSLLDKLRPK
jgi:tetratricopeptide (TPR) repeat protein